MNRNYRYGSRPEFLGVERVWISISGWNPPVLNKWRCPPWQAKSCLGFAGEMVPAMLKMTPGSFQGPGAAKSVLSLQLISGESVGSPQSELTNHHHRRWHYEAVYSSIFILFCNKDRRLKKDSIMVYRREIFYILFSHIIVYNDIFFSILFMAHPTDLNHEASLTITNHHYITIITQPLTTNHD